MYVCMYLLGPHLVLVTRMSPSMEIPTLIDLSKLDTDGEIKIGRSVKQVDNDPDNPNNSKQGP